MVKAHGLGIFFMRNCYQIPNRNDWFAKIACWEGGPLIRDTLLSSSNPTNLFHHFESRSSGSTSDDGDQSTVSSSQGFQKSSHAIVMSLEASEDAIPFCVDYNYSYPR